MTLMRMLVWCAWAFAIEFAFAIACIWVWKELR